MRLLGEKVQQTGVVAGMSGSPVYFDGRLVGALSLKLGTFTREAIGGVTPINDMFEIEKTPANAPTAAGIPSQVAVPQEFAQANNFPSAGPVGIGAGQFLVPIETPLIAAGLYPDTIARFGKDFASWGMTVMAGGTAPPSADEPPLKPGTWWESIWCAATCRSARVAR